MRVAIVRDDVMVEQTVIQNDGPYVNPSSSVCSRIYTMVAIMLIKSVLLFSQKLSPTMERSAP